MKNWNIFDRIEPTPAGRAYTAVKRAEELTNEAAAAVQEGADPEGIWQSLDVQDRALTHFKEVTGEDFYPHQEEAKAPYPKRK